MKNLKQLSDFFEVFAGATITATSGDKDLKFIQSFLRDNLLEFRDQVPYFEREKLKSFDEESAFDFVEEKLGNKIIQKINKRHQSCLLYVFGIEYYSYQLQNIIDSLVEKNEDARSVQVMVQAIGYMMSHPNHYIDSMVAQVVYNQLQPFIKRTGLSTRHTTMRVILLGLIMRASHDKADSQLNWPAILNNSFGMNKYYSWYVNRIKTMMPKLNALNYTSDSD